MAAHAYGFGQPPAGEFWLTGNRRGQLWRGTTTAVGLQNEAANRPDLLFTDLVSNGQAELAATDRGLFWRSGPADDWRSVTGPPGRYAYVVIEAGGRVYAGFEGEGVWAAAAPAGPWQPAGLAGRTVLDLAYEPVSARLYAATDGGVFVQTGPGQPWPRLSPQPPTACGPAPTTARAGAGLMPCPWPRCCAWAGF